jgi:hypothetical protein
LTKRRIIALQRGIVLDRAEKIAGAAFLPAVIAFAAAGNPHLVEEKSQHSNAVKTVIEAPSTSGDIVYRATWVPGEDILCTDNVDHLAYSAYGSQNGIGYCYSEKR